VSISIQRVGNRYTAVVTPMDRPEPWATSEPLTQRELIAKLRDLGCHTTDIGDAFYSADPDWLSRDEDGH
jgi:hypothetical protein